MTGHLDLAFSAAEGRTAVVRRRYTWPYAVGRGFHDGGVTSVVLQSGSGGIIGGDRLVQHLGAGEGARARVLGQGAVSVHRRHHGRGSREEVHLRVRGDSVLENLAQPRILFEDASLTQLTVVTVDSGAVLHVDALIAHGADAQCESVLEVRGGAGRVVRDRQRVASNLLPAGVRAVATVLGAGLVHDEALWRSWHETHGTTTKYGAASALPAGLGTVVRVVARDGALLREAVDDAVGLLRAQDVAGGGGH